MEHYLRGRCASLSTNDLVFLDDERFSFVAAHLERVFMIRTSRQAKEIVPYIFLFCSAWFLQLPSIRVKLADVRRAACSGSSALLP